MPRNRTSAKAAGARFERRQADILRDHVDDRIDRRVKTGSRDRGDIGGLRSAHGLRVVVEAKDSARTDLAGWHREALLEMGNDDAQVAVVAHKRHGVGDPLEQWITMTTRDLITLVTGRRPAEDGAIKIHTDPSPTDTPPSSAPVTADSSRPPIEADCCEPVPPPAVTVPEEA